MSINIVIYKREHDIKHYVDLSLQMTLVYIVFIAGLFSVPAAKIIAEKISDIQSVERGVIGETAFTLDIADTEEERLKGLGQRKNMPQNHAMLFVFDKSERYDMWMKDMEFPLDIVWLNEYSEVIYIERNISPNTFPKSFGPDKPSMYVIEFNAGFLERNNIKIGDKFVLM